ncbi:hypothetical protein [Paenibacillus puerhi]|uniref:hypothetical protein n=1 Tax=Paenibacillus puerhi TaxID=2692622 RepID=UPI00135C560D|nr:hypothetical protein [Paenibacillus puerhi]
MVKPGVSKWEEIRSKGKAQYVIKYGMLLWGLPIGIASAGLARVFDQDFSLEGFFSPELMFEMVSRALFFMIVAGPIFGWVMWKVYENKYERR